MNRDELEKSVARLERSAARTTAGWNAKAAAENHHGFYDALEEAATLQGDARFLNVLAEARRRLEARFPRGQLVRDVLSKVVR